MGNTVRREASWLGRTDVDDMLSELVHPGDDRRLGLFAAGCCRLLWPLLDPPAREAVAVFESFADGRAGPAEVLSLRVGGRSGRPAAAAWAAEAVNGLRNWPDGHLTAARAVAAHAARAARDAVGEWAWTRARQVQAGLLCDVFGAGFRPPWAVPPQWLRWNDGCLGKMARVIYDGHLFDELPVLADALEEAGCADAGVLAHCRDYPRHTRGCWVVESLLGRA
jgi:hypothetical protein